MNPNSIFPQSDDRLFSFFGTKVIQGLFTKGPNGENDSKLFLYITGLCLIVATEPFKVLLRRNIGKLSLSMNRIYLAVLFYLFWGLILFGISYIDEVADVSEALVAGSIFYLLFAFSVLAIGIAENSKAKQSFTEYPMNNLTIIKHLYRGDSIYFKTTNQEKTWLITEPVACFVITLLLTVLPAFIHPVFIMIGLPLFITSISFWFNEWYQIKNVFEVQSQKIIRELTKVQAGQSNPSNEQFGSAS